MKNNRLIYLLIIILFVWILALSILTNKKYDSNIHETIIENNISGFSTDLTKVVEKCKDSIVTINANGTVSSGFVYKQEESNIYILTSYHGVSESNILSVVFSGGLNMNAELIGKDIYTDLAVLRIESPYNINSLSLSDSSKLKDGEFIICLGTPFSIEYNQTVELGMISKNHRVLENSITVDNENYKYYVDLIQLSSNLNPGFSGSPLLNMNGEVVGVVNMALNNKTNFAISSNEIKIIADSIISDEELVRNNLGIKGSYVHDMPMFEKTNLNLPVDVINGFYVDGVLMNSLANLANVKNGDVILSINDIEINNIVDYLDILYSHSDSFDFKVYRDSNIINLKVNTND